MSILSTVGSILQKNGQIDLDMRHQIKFGSNGEQQPGVLCDRSLPLKSKGNFIG